MGRLQVADPAARLRVGAWRGSATVAQIVPFPGRAPSAEALADTLARLGDDGYRTVLTSALAEGEQARFYDAGFVVHQRLTLLRCTGLPPQPDAAPPSPGVRLRAGRRWDRAAVLAVDAAAFDDFWRLDAEALRDALAATPSVRFRVAARAGTVPTRPGRGRGIVGYAICGRAGSVGYLQRLAVHPAAAGHGVGAALVHDALRWAARRGAGHVLVNTQEDNRRALDLYQRLGFVAEQHGLAVLARELPAPEHPAPPT